MRILYTVIVATSAWSAPVPKDIPAPDVKPGVVVTLWCTSPWVYDFRDDGTCVGTLNSCVYCGIWSWDSKKRELMLTESCDGWQTWRYYLFRLDSQMVGRCIESAYNGDADSTPSGVVWRVGK